MIVIMFSLNKLINCQRYSSLLLSSLFVSFYFCSVELLCRPNQTWLAAICHIKVNWNQNIRSRVDRLFIPSTATAHTSIYWLILTRPMHITLCTAIRNKKREQNPPNASIWRSSPPDTKDPKCFHLKVLSITSHSLPTPIKCIKIHCYLVIQIPLFQNLKPSVIIPTLLFHDHTVFQVTVDPFDSYQQVVGSFFWAAWIWIAKTCWLSWAKMGVGRMRKVGYMDGQ